MSYSYELMYILRPDLLEEQVQQEINKYRDFLSDHQAEEIKIKNWGKRRLAYPIKKLQDGFYVQMNFKGNGQQIAPIERAMRLSDEVIRYLTTKYKDEELAATEPTELAAEPSKPPTESPKPVTEPNKAVSEPTKPVTEPNKAVAEAPKPPVEDVAEVEVEAEAEDISAGE